MNVASLFITSGVSRQISDSTSKPTHSLLSTDELDHSYSKCYVQGHIDSCKTSASDRWIIDQDQSEVCQKKNYQYKLSPATSDLQNDAVNRCSDDWELPEMPQDFILFDQVENSTVNDFNDTNDAKNNHEYSIDTLNVSQNISFTGNKDNVFFSVFDKLPEAKKDTDTQKYMVNNSPEEIINTESKSDIHSFIVSQKNKVVITSVYPKTLFKSEPCDNRKYSTNSGLSDCMKPTNTEFYKCGECTSIFFNKRQLNGHIKKEHCNIMSHQCVCCEKNYKSINELKDHMKKTHNVPVSTVLVLNIGLTQTPKLTLKPKPKPKPKPISVKDDFMCQSCKKVFARRWNMTCYEKNKFQCKMCEKSYKYKYSLKRHMEKHPTNEFICSICKQSYKKT